MPNPFKPSFGVSPPLLVGRDSLIEEFADGLEDGPGSPSRATLYTGARGAGKTVMLNAVEERARALGWVAISETAAPGLVDRLTQRRLPEVLRSFDPDAVRRRLTGVTIPFRAAGLTWETLERHVAEADLRSQINLLTELLQANGAGLLITLDEIHRQQIAELRELATTIQHAFREERELAFAGAGLTAAVSDVLNDDVLTFLRRADRHHLGRVPLDEVRRALREPIVAAGREAADEAVDVMAEGTRGYPFLIQLVGAQSWRVHRTAREISVEDAETAVAQARRRLASLVYDPALDEASDVDRSFLLAMAQDDGPSRMVDVIERLGTTSNYASVYRRRLIDAELIEPAGRGRVDFALPYLREYLRERAATDAAP